MKHPKGYLVAIGGAEDKGEKESKDEKSRVDFYEEGILEKIVELAGKKGEPIIEVITSASSVPDELFRTYKKAFEKLGCTKVGHLHIAHREQAEDPKIADRLHRCTCVLFSGGDQSRLCSLLGGTPVLGIVKERYQTEPFVVAGTSAGAAAMSSTIIGNGNEEKAFIKGEVTLSIGFGFLEGAIIDTHFDKRGRFGRLAQAVAMQPGITGLGLGEDSGMIIEKGMHMKAIGSSSIVIIDGSTICRNNIAETKEGAPITLSDLKVHILSNSDLFDLSTKEVREVQFSQHQK